MISLKEKILNGMLYASNVFKSFYDFGFFFLIVLNTISLIVLFTFLASTYIDNLELFSLILMIIKILNYVLIFWIISLGLSIIFKIIANIMYKQQEKEIIIDLHGKLPIVKLRRGKNAKSKTEI